VKFYLADHGSVSDFSWLSFGGRQLMSGVTQLRATADSGFIPCPELDMT